MSSPEAISQRDAAKRLGVSTATIERWVRRGQLNTIRTGKNHGARRVLTDEAFHAAATRPHKTHHNDSATLEKSITNENPSRPDSDHPIAVDTTADPGRGTDDGFASLPLPPRQADPVGAAAKSIASRREESITASATESLTTGNPEIGSDELLETGLEAGLGVQTPSPRAAQSPSPLAERARSERSRPPLRPSDADLVPLTGRRPSRADARTETSAAPARSRMRLRARAATGVLLVALAAAAALAITRPWQQAPQLDSFGADHSPAGRGAQAQTIRSQPAGQPVARSLRARGGLARATPEPKQIPTAAPPTPTTPAQNPKPAQSAPQPVPPTRPHRQHPITPCQSSGICVRP
jgi:excisionase family DNA binding protein